MRLPIFTTSAYLPKRVPGARPASARLSACVAALLLLSALMALCGCGGGVRAPGKKTGKGAAVFTITWPSPRKSARFIPAKSNVIRIQIKDSTDATATVYGTLDSVRPVSGPLLTTLTFNNLPPGQFFATATAYPDYATPPVPPGLGTLQMPAQATATLPLTIANGQTTAAQITMNTTIAHVLGMTTPPPPQTAVFILPGSAQTTRGFTPFTFTPQAKDTAGALPGNTVLIVPNNLQVTVSDSAIARLSDNGSGTFSLSNAGKLGAVTVTVKELESGFAQSFTLTFLSAYIYIADSNNNRLVRIDDLNQPATDSANFHTYGTGGNGNVQFDYPQQLTVDSLNRVYVADTGNNRIARIDDITDTSPAHFASYYGTPNDPTQQLNNPYGVALDTLGHFYIADSGNQRIVRIDNFAGAAPRLFGSYGNGPNQFGGPIQVAMDSHNYLYVTDPFNNRIVQIKDINRTDAANFTPYGTYGSQPGNFDGPYGIAVDSQDRIYIADTNNGRIARINDISGAGYTSYDASNSGNSFAFPIGIAFDPQNRIYIADSSNNRIVRIDDMTGTNFMAVGRLDRMPGAGTGEFSYPYGIAVH